jgi:O-antigen/teichoic acid export membrane protein
MMKDVHSSSLLSKIASVAAIRGASAIFAFLLSWMIVHFRSLDALGSFSFALVTVQLVGALALLGIDSLLLRLMIKALSAGKSRLAVKYVNEAFAAATLMAIPGILLCWAIAGAVMIFRESLYWAGESLIIMAPVVLCTAISKVSAGRMRGHGQVTLSQVIDGTLPSFIALAGLLISNWMGVKTFLVPVYYVLGAAISAGIGLFLIRNDLRGLRFIYRPGTIGRSLRFTRASLPIQYANVANYLTDWTATAALAIWLPLSAVAIYRVISQIGMVFVLVVTAFEIPVSTAVSAAHLARDLPRLRQVITSTRWLMIATAAVPIAAVFIFAGPILQLFFKLGNDTAILCLRIILIGQIVNVVTGPVGSALVMMGGARQLVRISWTVLIVMVLSTAVMTPWQGVVGVCIAAAFSLSLRNLMNYWRVNRLIAQIRPATFAPPAPVN